MSAFFAGVLTLLLHPTMILGILGLLILSYALRNLFFHPLSGIPGPLSARTGLCSWKTIRALKLDMGWNLLELHKKYGKIVRIARNEASICDPSAISQIYKFKSPLQKTQFYESLRGLDGPTSISTMDNKRHAEMRRAESPAYATKMFVDFEQNVDSCCTDLGVYLDRCIDAEMGTVDLGQILQMFAIDVVGELALGRSFGLCAAGKDTHNFLPMLVKFLEMACVGMFSQKSSFDLPNSIVAVGTQPVVVPIFRWLSQMLPELPSARILTSIVNGHIDMRFKEYREKETYSSHQDMLGSILGAGSDTTAITMRAMIRFIVGDVEIYRKVEKEIDDAVNCGAITFPLSYSDGGKLSYFQACLRETLRLHPPVPWTLARSVGAGGANIADHFFAEGTEVSMSPFVLHRCPEAYGDDAAVFRPERWIEADAEQRKMMEHNNLAFGSGPRVCIGKTIGEQLPKCRDAMKLISRVIGMMEVSKVVPFLFWKYKIGFTPRSATSPHTHRLVGPWMVMCHNRTLFCHQPVGCTPE
ncbi:cytochrome P450 oxidoreductase [Mycena leptocephala]|nr:cytochrome P450 oxidoreductase [Mycena leptocephala]